MTTRTLAKCILHYICPGSTLILSPILIACL